MPAPYGIDLRERVLKACKNSNKTSQKILWYRQEQSADGSNKKLTKVMSNLKHVIKKVIATSLKTTKNLSNYWKRIIFLQLVRLPRHEEEAALQREDWGVLKKKIKQCQRIIEDVYDVITLALNETQEFGQP